MNSPSKHYGLSIVDRRNIIFHFGFRFYEIWLTPPKKRKHFGWICHRLPDLEQCLYSMQNRGDIKIFIGIKK